jgi:hypothetical protein
MKRILIFAIVALFLFVPEVLFAKKQPDWIVGQSKKYPSPRYFIGVGAYKARKGAEKQSRDIASDRARAEIAKTIKTEVQSEVRETRTVEASKRDKKGTYKTDSKQSEMILARSSEVLEGVEIKEYYRDRKEGVIYALAVLDRIKTAGMLEDRIQKSQKMLFVEVEQAKADQLSGNYLRAIGNYENAFANAQKITALNELLFIMSPTATKFGSSDFHYEPEISKAISMLKKRIKPCVNIEGEAKSVSSYVKGGLANSGYTVVGEKSSACNYIISGDTSLFHRGEIDMGGKDMIMQIYEASANLKVIDNSTGDVLKTESWRVNANDKTMASAKNSAVRALGDLIKKQVATKLFGI